MQVLLNNIPFFRQNSSNRNLTNVLFCAIITSQLKFMAKLFSFCKFQLLSNVFLYYYNFNSNLI